MRNIRTKLDGLPEVVPYAALAHPSSHHEKYFWVRL